MGILKLKSALLATAALGVSAATAVPALAAESHRTEVAQAQTPLAHAADEAQPALAKQAGWLAAGAAVLAALAGLVGWKRIRRAAAEIAPMAKNAVAVAAAAPAAALRAVGKATSRPFRFMAGLMALAAFALFGVGLYDVEWAGGLVAGALSVAAVWLTAGRARRFARAFARRK